MFIQYVRDIQVGQSFYQGGTVLDVDKQTADRMIAQGAARYFGPVDSGGLAYDPSTGALVDAAGVIAVTSQEDIYIQPDATGTWADRPSGLVLPIPTWANFLTLGLGSGGGSGGSGRQGATGSGIARSGGAGGQCGIAMLFRIPLRNAVRALLALTGTLTVGASTAGGASTVGANTDGSPGATAITTSFVFNGVSYQANGGGTAAPGGGSIPVGGGANVTSMFVVGSVLPTNVTANIGLFFPSGITSPGSPGGSISAADVLLTVGGINLSQTGGPTLASTTAGANGSGHQRGHFMAAVGGNGGLSSNSVAAGAGGNGIHGSGGGGGGASLNGNASGAGGRGGAGWAILQWSV